MAHSIRNPEILHWVEDDGRYACNKASSVTPTKRAFYLTEITCKNCLKEINREKLSDQLTNFFRVGKPSSCFANSVRVQEMIQKAVILEENVETLERYAKSHRVTIIRDTRECE